tara:strand:+ start:1727 stop:2296 length:570 start_codon:yes stop_codon:yes gene_type:complete
MSVIQERLADIQQALKAPKGQRNDFAKFNYRSCSDIVEAVKGHLNGATITLSDDVVAVGDRVYVKATATLTYEAESVSTTAFAREAVTKKGMDDSQITGTASSYARKYALNGLFAIDDTKDADTNAYATATTTALATSKNAMVKAVTDNDAGACQETWRELTSSEQESIWSDLPANIRSAIKELLKAAI